MKLIENKIEKLKQEHDLLGIYEQIEIAGRTAYKSLDKKNMMRMEDLKRLKRL